MSRPTVKIVVSGDVTVEQVLAVVEFVQTIEPKAIVRCGFNEMVIALWADSFVNALLKTVEKSTARRDSRGRFVKGEPND